MVNFKRLADHIFFLPGAQQRAFPPAVLKTIEDEISASEMLHDGELRVAIEGNLDMVPVWRGLSGRARAIELFSLHRNRCTRIRKTRPSYLLMSRLLEQLIS